MSDRFARQAAGTERAVVEGEESVVGRDPRKMTQAEMRAAGHEPKPVLTALRERCIDCCGGSQVEVRRCVAVDCPAWPFRMGFNPWRDRSQITSEKRAEIGQRLRQARRADPAKAVDELSGGAAGDET